ncbi:hypothetical protein BV25DRAFT_1916809 [Artomyces pyxidatus]|uniref:Uncharacterized protein n=1 Tax=Artomyces pyxidatus TaxID=48021 RepID=A0ACB8SZ36_9AGAM|nr:hypothetical protein BV25DRAFT_1916809 [Artomyces pyxidatus]
MPSGVLIRPEYREALDAAVDCAKAGAASQPSVAPDPVLDSLGGDSSPTAQWNLVNEDNPFENEGCVHRAAFILRGQSGTGKALWELYVLALRLQAKKVTIYQNAPGHFYVFDEEGVWDVSANDGDYSGTLDEYVDVRAWAIVASNEVLAQVSPFLKHSRRFIVQAASPRKDRTEWLRTYSSAATVFIMKPWTLDELLAARTLQPYPVTEAQIVNFFDQFGPPVRTVHVAFPGRYNDRVSSALQPVTRDTFYAAALRIFGFHCHDDEIAYGLLAFTHGNVRHAAKVYIPTRGIYNRLHSSFGRYVFGTDPSGLDEVYRPYLESQ